MRLGRFRNGYLVPYPDITTLPLEARSYGDFQSDRYYLKRMDPTDAMKQIFGSADRIYYVEDLSFIAYCRGFYKQVLEINVPDIPSKAAKRPNFYVVGTCRKCKREYVIDTGYLTRDRIIEILKKKPFGEQRSGPALPFGECPAGGWHTEMGTLWDNMDFDLSHTYQGGEI